MLTGSDARASRPAPSAAQAYPNGDEYVGSWRGALPHGTGTYAWADGSRYEGEWREGVKHGLGKYRWPGGATYDGPWVEGCMEGVGKYVAPDGVMYSGSYLKDKKHGLGKKTYANGDVYEGLWKEDLPHGIGIYKWDRGDEFNGEWSRGKMHGQGTFVWKSGERYDGQWRNGVEDGTGIFAWPNGSAYKGYWKGGKKNGVGVWWRPEDIKSDGQPSARPGTSRKGSVQTQDLPMSERLALAASEGKVIVREYEMGKLLREDWIPVDKVPLPDFQKLYAKTKTSTKSKRRQIGETIIKGHRSYDLMLNLQLGIRYSVSKIMNGPLEPLTDSHFDKTVCKELYFPKEGSSITPPHNGTDFKWKDYCPMVWRHLRDTFGSDPASYMLSICGVTALRELSSPGKSGSVFYISHDDKHMIKSMRKAELSLLCSILPHYYRHMTMCSDSLLPKFFGLHRIKKPTKAQRVRFVVMSNVFETDLPMHKTYDLKGSTQGRLTTKPVKDTTILKDLDLDCTFKLETGWRDKLMNQLQIDCALLEELQVMDYSLLLGVHYRDAHRGPASPEKPLGNGDAAHAGGNGPEGGPEGAAESGGEGDQSPEGAKAAKTSRESQLVKNLSTPVHRARSLSQAIETRQQRSNSLRPMEHAAGGTEELALLSGRSFVTLGTHMAATAIPNDPSKGQPRDVVLFFGIIDILQEYNVRKRIEHASKSVITEKDTMSAVNPTVYSKRFQNFLRSVFS